MACTALASIGEGTSQDAGADCLLVWQGRRISVLVAVSPQLMAGMPDQECELGACWRACRTRCPCTAPPPPAGWRGSSASRQPPCQGAP